MTIGNNIRTVKATISSWELDRTRPKMDKREELCAAPGCEKSDIVGKDNVSVSHELTPEEWEIIIEYRNSDELSREAVKRLLAYSKKLEGKE